MLAINRFVANTILTNTPIMSQRYPQNHQYMSQHYPENYPFMSQHYPDNHSFMSQHYPENHTYYESTLSYYNTSYLRGQYT
jgi:hypothetical protein